MCVFHSSVYMGVHLYAYTYLCIHIHRYCGGYKCNYLDTYMQWTDANHHSYTWFFIYIYIYIYIYICIYIYIYIIPLKILPPDRVSFKYPIRWQKLLGSARSGSTRLELPKLCYHPGWRLMRLGYRTCFHTLYDEKYIYNPMKVCLKPLVWWNFYQQIDVCKSFMKPKVADKLPRH